MSSFIVHAIFPVAVLVLLCLCAATDFAQRIIPNELVIAIAASGLAQGVISRPERIWLSLLLASGLFCALAILAFRKVMGGGDMKLIAAVTLIAPPEQVGQLLLEIVLAGGVLSCAYLAARGMLNRRSPSPPAGPNALPAAGGLATILDDERARILSGSSVPYGIAVLGGTAIYLVRVISQCIFATSCSL